MNSVLLFVAAFGVLTAGEASVDLHECAPPCFTAFTNGATSPLVQTESHMCLVTMNFINCMETECQLQSNNLPAVFYEFIRNVYNQTGKTCALYDSEEDVPTFIHPNTQRLIDSLYDLFSTVADKCFDLKGCLKREVLKGVEANETTPCNSNNAMKVCLYESCPTTNPSATFNLLNLIFFKMEQKGHRCDKEGLHSVQTTTTTTTTTHRPSTTTATTFQVDVDNLPECSHGIQYCIRIYGNIMAGCRIDEGFITCVRYKCGVSRLPTYLLQELERERRQQGYNCDLTSSSGAGTGRASVWSAAVLTFLILRNMV